MPFRNRETGAYPVSHEQIRQANPGTTFPAYFEEADGHDWVFPTTPPVFDPETHYREEGEPELVDGKWQQTWVIHPFSAEAIAQKQAQKAQQDFLAAKAKREQQVAEIKVTTQAGNTFDGDETSQGRMARAIIALQAAGGTVGWVMADNSIAQVTAAELTEALALAGAAQAAIWVAPYVE